jgi:signal transduction histidine kinase
MQILIEDILSYSRVTTSQIRFEETDINLLLQGVKNELNDTIVQKNAIIDSSPLPYLRVIPFQFTQLLTNIISNALKFSKQDYLLHIIIIGEMITGNKINEPEADPVKNYYHISISDNGIGFDQNFSKKIFEIFQRLHGQNEYTGTGIGLAICKKIVENHLGFITAQGELNKGATFNIYLPVLPVETAEIKQ